MSVRSVVRSPVDSPVRSVFAGSQFNPILLFGTGAQGAWYDPSDFSTLYQTSTGTTPVTAVEQPVGLMLDRSRGLVLGSELVTNGSFTTDSDWTKGTGWTIAGGQAVATAVAAGQALRQTIVAPTNISYWIEFDIVVTSGGVNVWIGTSGTFFSVTSSGLSRVLLRASGANDITISAAVTGFTGTIDNVSIKALPGNHASQATSASRPVLRARYNLLTYSEQFDNAGWTKGAATVTANSATAPDGTTTADTLTETVDNTAHNIIQTITTTASSTVTLSASAKPQSGTRYFTLSIDGDGSNYISVTFDLVAGTATQTLNSGYTIVGSATITLQNNGFYRCSFTAALSATAATLFRLSLATAATFVSFSRGMQGYTGDGTSGILIWGAQLLTAADQTSTGGAYQRIAAATDYDVSNPVWRPYLAFDGVDDFMVTASVDLTGTDKTTIFVGMHKPSDAAGNVVLGHGADFDTVGAFELRANTAASAQTAYRGRSTAGSTATAGFTRDVVAPATLVFASPVDYAAAAGAEFSGRYNGVVQAQNVGLTQENTGTFGNNVLTIGSRQGGASQRFNGRIYGLTVLGRTATAAELSAMETWVAGKTGVNLA